MSQPVERLSSISGLRPCMIGAAIMRHWWYDYVRSLCYLESQLRSFEQLAATDFAREISLRSSHDIKIFMSQVVTCPGVTGAFRLQQDAWGTGHD